MARLGNVDRFKKSDIEDIIDGLIRIFQLDKYSLSEDVEVLESLDHGSIIFWQKLWHDLKLSVFLRQAVCARHPHLQLAVERYVEMLVVNRCICPDSKLGAVNRWLPTTSYKALQGYDNLNWDVNYFYRSMDYLIEVKDELEAGIFKQLQNLFSVNVKLTFYDITSSYLYGDECPLAEHGYSRDHRSDCEQIVVGVVTSYEGYPLKHFVFSGDTADSTTVVKVVRELRQSFHIEETIFVGDRGMITKLNLAQLETQGYDYIMGVKLRQDALCHMLFARGDIDWELAVDNEKKTLKLLERPGSVTEFLLWKTREILKKHHLPINDDAFQPFKDRILALTNESKPVTADFKADINALSPDMTAKIHTQIWQVIVRYEGRYERVYRFVFCLNPTRQKQSRDQREERLKSCQQQLDNLFSDKKDDAKTSASKTEAALKKIFKGSKSRYLKYFEIERDETSLTLTGYRLNESVIAATAKYDGIFVLLSSRTDVKMETVVESYKNLQEVEILFDDFKNFVDVRPLRHRLEKRVRAHVCICIWALLLKRIAEINYLGGKAVTESLAEIDQIKLIHYKVKFSVREDRNQTLYKVTTISPNQQHYFKKIGLKNPASLEKLTWWGRKK